MNLPSAILVRCYRQFWRISEWFSHMDSHTEPTIWSRTQVKRIEARFGPYEFRE